VATPKTFLVGITQPDSLGILGYLKHTKQEEFYRSMLDAEAGGVPSSLCLVSMFAKMCYRSLVTGKNANVSRVRDIEDNIKCCIDSGHGSVFEHVTLNFVTTNCSRVFTHELVRHRVGTAFSQTSGRYCTVEDAELVLPPELDDIDLAAPEEDLAGLIGVEMNEMLADIKARVAKWRITLNLDDPATDFATKKRPTSALRRIMPNGATNEIAWSVNVRSLRHMIQMRSSRHAEWEIRQVFHEVAEIVNERWPLMLYGGKCEVIDGFSEWTGLRV